MGVRDTAHAVARNEAIANGKLLTSLTGLPVNGDLEDGFGTEPADCAATVEAAIAAGLAGVGIEDTTADPVRPIHSFDLAVARVRAAARVAHGRIMLTARTDNYLHGRPDLSDTIRRLTAFAEAGADVLYAPGLGVSDAIAAVVRAVAPKPVNVSGGLLGGVAFATWKKRHRQGLGLMESWSIVERTASNRMSCIELTLSEWLYNAVIATEVRTLSGDYF